MSFGFSFGGDNSRGSANGPQRKKLSRRKQKAQSQRNRKLFFEGLEDRRVLAAMVWDGDINGQWSVAANWKGDVAPAAGDDLVFPAGAANTTNVNDLAAGTRFNTILIGGSGYNISGNAIELFGGLTANNSSGTNSFGLNTTLINAQTVMNANPGSTLNFSGSIDTANLVGNYFFGTAPALMFDGAGTTNASGVISGAGSISKLGSGTVVLSGTNTYEGITEARQGYIRVANNSGLGSATTGHTEVQAGAAVELSGVTTGETFAIREGGVGFGTATDISSAGALRAVGGTTSTITGNVELVGGDNMIGVTAGSKLIVSGQVLTPLSKNAGNRFLKVGPGTLQLAGTQDNVFTVDTRVIQGTLELNKTPGKNAIGGNLIIGDNLGGDNNATVRLLQPDQLPQLNVFDVSINTITLSSSGVLDLNNNSDVIGNLVLTTGSTYSSDVTSGSGTLTLGGNLTVNTFQGSSGVTPAATISGKLDLGAFFSGGASGGGLSTRTFAINDTQLAHINTDLDISAVISGTSDVSISKTGGGTLRLSNANTISGPFIMNNGVVEIANNNAFGTSFLSLQNSSNILRATGGSRTISNAVSLDGDVTFLGDDNLPGVENLTFTAPVNLTGNRTLLAMDPTQTVTFAGAIGEGIFGSLGISKGGRGTVALTAANTYSGTTNVNTDGGTLVLKDGGSILNSGTININAFSSLVLDNNSGANLDDRVNDFATINNSGRLALIGSSVTNTTENLGPVVPGTNVSTIIESQNTSAGTFTTKLIGNALTTGADRPTRFVGTGLALSDNGANRIVFTNTPGTLTNAIMQQGVVAGPGNTIDFATFASVAEGTAIVALPTSAYVTDISLATPTSNVRVTSSTVLSTNKNINALLVDPGVTLGGNNAVLTLGAGNLIFAGNGTIDVGALNIGAGITNVQPGSTATINSSIYSGTVQKNNLGKLILTGDNQFNGLLMANEGTLNLQRSTAVGSPQSGTFARAGATIELEQTTFGPVIVGLEAFDVTGSGDLTNQGALRNVSGNNSIAGSFTLGGGVMNVLDMYGGWMGITSANVTMGFVNVEGSSTLTLTGSIGNNADLNKTGSGTLELAGVQAGFNDRSSRVYAGTLLLNREPGLGASSGYFSTLVIGSDASGAPAATAKLGASDQIRDDRAVTALSSGLFDLNGQADRISGGTLVVGPNGAGDINIGAGGTLSQAGDINVFTLGVGNPTGSVISGGTLALQNYGVISAAGVRTFQVNDGAIGNDLTITSAVVDGTGLQSVGITKSGFGTLELGGVCFEYHDRHNFGQ